MKELTIVSIGGYGHSGQVFDEIADIPGLRFAGLAPAYEGEDISKFAKHRTFGDSPALFSDYATMLRVVKPDVAVIGTRLDHVASATTDAAKAGCHVISEKPLAITHAELDLLRDAVTKDNVRLIAMFNMRRHRAFAAARNLYREGAIGEIVLANTRKSYRWGKKRPEWYSDRKIYGGTIPWIGIHALDMINFITGVSFDSVAAMHSNFAHPDRPGCEDNCALTLTLSNGGHMTASVDYMRPSTAPTHGDDWIRLVGTHGVIEAHGTRETCHVINEERGEFEAELPEEATLYRPFVESLQMGAEFDLMSADDPFMLTKTCLVARDSADEGGVVKSLK